MARPATQRRAVTSPILALLPQQQLFCQAVARGRSAEVAARMAGYKKPNIQGSQMLKKPWIQEAIRFLNKKYEQVLDMTRKKVMDGFLEAIEIAKIQAQPGDMISGWREIAKMCGYYAPEVKKIDISISAKRVIDQMETLSDEDLLKMVEESAEIIEGEATLLLEELQSAA